MDSVDQHRDAIGQRRKHNKDLLRHGLPGGNFSYEPNDEEHLRQAPVDLLGVVGETLRVRVRGELLYSPVLLRAAQVHRLDGFGSHILLLGSQDGLDGETRTRCCAGAKGSLRTDRAQRLRKSRRRR